MPAVKTYLVPVDFSKISGKALNYAVRLARETRAQLLIVHVITDSPADIPINLREKHYQDLATKAVVDIEKLMRTKTRRDMKFGTRVIADVNPARSISEQASKSRVSMIVMGSRGRTGLERLMVGSVAEATVRLARCPVLIVK